jgi:hypothetical protein
VRDEFYSTFAGKSAAQIKAHWSNIIFTGRGQPPKSVGYIERNLVDNSVKVLAQP